MDCDSKILFTAAGNIANLGIEGWFIGQGYISSPMELEGNYYLAMLDAFVFIATTGETGDHAVILINCLTQLDLHKEKISMCGEGVRR